MLNTSRKPALFVIGAGPAGLTAAVEAGRVGFHAVVVEKNAIVGGLARTECYKGFLFDLGGHRFFTKVEWVNDWWRDVLGDALLRRPRLSRILYANTFFSYPPSFLNAVSGLGPVEGLRIALRRGVEVDRRRPRVDAGVRLAAGGVNRRHHRRAIRA